MLHVIYKITNKVNGRYYIGKHQPRNLDDGYMGSGKIIDRAIKKYGIENFQKEILCICKNKKEMNSKERSLINLQDSKIYNIAPGGAGGFSVDMIFSWRGKKRPEHSEKMKVAMKNRKITWRDKISKAKTGVPAVHLYKACTDGKIIFESVQDLCRVHNISSYTFRNRVKKYDNWSYI